MSQALAADLPKTSTAAPAYPSQPPQYPQGVASRQALVTAPNVNFTTPTADAPLISAADNPAGCLIKRLSAQPLGTWTQTVLQIFKKAQAPNAGPFGSSAATSKIMSDALTAQNGASVSATSLTPPFDFPRISSDNPIHLGPGEELSVAASVALAAGWAFSAEVEFYAVKPQ